MACDKIDRINIMISDYLKRNNIYSKDRCWEIQTSSLGGRGLFATRDIHPGEIICVDHPIIIGPRSRADSNEICVSCYKNYDLIRCSRKCGLPVCSKECENSDNHKKECLIINNWKNTDQIIDGQDLSRCLTPIRYLLLCENNKNLVKLLKCHCDPKHGAEIVLLKNKFNLALSDQEEISLRFVCSVLDANAFEVIVGNESKQSGLRGLYPLSSLANHHCSANTMHVFDSKQRMIVRATLFIPKGSEIFHSYVRVIWGTLTRRYHLYKTKHFACSCDRCCDPSEFGGNVSALTCQSCKGVVLPTEPLALKSIWKCTNCNEIMPGNRVAIIFSTLGSKIGCFDDSNDVAEMLLFLDGKFGSFVKPTNQIAVELKYKLIWILGYDDGYSWEELTNEYLQRKEEICRELLDLLTILKTGLCKMRGLLLYELYLCLKERQKRVIGLNGQEINNNIIKNSDLDVETKKLFEEAADILMFDVGAPQEIKDSWPNIDLTAKIAHAL